MLMMDLFLQKPNWVDSKSLGEDLKSFQLNSGEQLADNTEEGNAAIVVAVALVTRVYGQSDYVSIPHILWYFISCSFGMTAPVQHSRTSAGMASLLGALTGARDSRAILSLPRVDSSLQRLCSL